MHFDTPIFFLLVLVAMLFRWLTSAANKAAKKNDESARGSTSTPRTTAPVPRAPADTDEDRIRKFLEALGQPPGSRPPPIVQPRADVPPRPVAPVQPPLSPFSIPQGRLARKILPRGITKSAYQEKPSVPPTAEPAVFQVREETATAPEPSPMVAIPVEAYVAVTQEPATLERKDINRLLKSSSGLRDAIILREILGPPRSLQPLDATGSA